MGQPHDTGIPIVREVWRAGARVAQKEVGVADKFGPFRVDNSGPVENACEAVLAYLAALSHHVSADLAMER